MEPVRMLKAKNVAEALGVSVVRAYQLMKESSFPSIKLGSSVRVRDEDFVRWIENKVQQKEASA